MAKTLIPVAFSNYSRSRFDFSVLPPDEQQNYINLIRLATPEAIREAAQILPRTARRDAELVASIRGLLNRAAEVPPDDQDPRPAMEEELSQIDRELERLHKRREKLQHELTRMTAFSVLRSRFRERAINLLTGHEAVREALADELNL